MKLFSTLLTASIVLLSLSSWSFTPGQYSPEQVIDIISSNEGSRSFWEIETSSVVNGKGGGLVSKVLQKALLELQTRPRRGLLQRGLEESRAERIWEHTKALARATEIFVNLEGLDVKRAVAIALVHDIAEYSYPDLTPIDRVPKRKKQRGELKAMKKLVKNLNLEHTGLGDAIFALWWEYEQGLSAEALVVKQLDKMDAYVNSLRFHELDNSDYYKSIQKKLVHPRLIYIARWFHSMRETILDPYESYFRQLKLPYKERHGMVAEWSCQTILLPANGSLAQGLSWVYQN